MNSLYDPPQFRRVAAGLMRYSEQPLREGWGSDRSTLLTPAASRAAALAWTNTLSRPRMLGRLGRSSSNETQDQRPRPRPRVAASWTN